jgi:hypothetical protein
MNQPTVLSFSEFPIILLPGSGGASVRLPGGRLVD